MGRLFAEEDKAAVLDILLQRYAHRLQNERFVVDGRVEPGFVELRLILERNDGTFRYDMRFYASLKDNHISADEGRDLVIDFMGYYLDRYFRSNRQVMLPLEYLEFRFGEHKVFARGDVTNPRLEALADEIIEKGITISPDDPRLKGL